MKNKTLKSRKDNSMTAMIAVLVIFVAAIVLIAILSRGLESDGGDAVSDSTDVNTGASSDTSPDISIEKTDFAEMSLGDGLYIRNMYKYTGIFMEDGTDDAVTNVMMIVIENTSEKDLQLADIEIKYKEYTAKFRATNIPSGEKAVLLEQSRLAPTEEKPESCSSSNVIFFDEPMNSSDERLEVTGGDGFINVKNVSDTDISGEIYVYYKYSSADMFYGGITFRTKLDGLKSGETKTAVAGHYTSKGCTVVMITCD